MPRIISALQLIHKLVEKLEERDGMLTDRLVWVICSVMKRTEREKREKTEDELSISLPSVSSALSVAGEKRSPMFLMLWFLNSQGWEFSCFRFFFLNERNQTGQT